MLLNAGFEDLSERHKKTPRKLVLKEHGKVQLVDSAINDTTARINCNLEPGVQCMKCIVWYHDKGLVGKVGERFICG